MCPHFGNAAAPFLENTENLATLPFEYDLEILTKYLIIFFLEMEAYEQSKRQFSKS